MMDKLKTGTLAGLLLLTGMAALVAVPSVAAHDCSSLTPEGCGVCDPTEDHHHYVSYTGKSVMWCFYDGPNPGPDCLENLAACFGETRFNVYAPNLPSTPDVEL